MNDISNVNSFDLVMLGICCRMGIPNSYVGELKMRCDFISFKFAFTFDNSEHSFKK